MSLAGEKRCGCPAWRRHKGPCKHVFAALIWAAKARRVLACRVEVHHHVPRYLLGFYDRFNAGDLDGEGLQAWFDWEEGTLRYGVDPNFSREGLEALIEASLVPTASHHANHSEAGDFPRWGQRGGLRTLALYGRGWFALLARRRWERITAKQLAELFAVLSRGRS